MQDTRALQSGTSHFFGQNFAKAFEIQYLDPSNTLQYCWTTSWGLSSRMVGAVIMTHGDDQGLILPPKIAPLQVVIVPIYKNDTEKSSVLESTNSVFKDLKDSGIRVKLDDREEVTPGFKYNYWELRGVPVRIEIGPKDVEQQSVTVARRDVPGKSGKSSFTKAEVAAKMHPFLLEIQDALLARATAFRDEHIHEPASYDDLKNIVQDGWAFAYWCGSTTCETKVKEETKATTRCIPLEGQPKAAGKCVVCGNKAEKKVYFARAY